MTPVMNPYINSTRKTKEQIFSRKFRFMMGKTPPIPLVLCFFNFRGNGKGGCYISLRFIAFR